MDEEERRELVSRLFALMTGKLEDAAGLAAEGQGTRAETRDLISRAERIESIAQEAAVLAEAVGAIVKPR